MLYLTIIDNKKYTIMINKKKDLILIDIELSNELYNNTLLDGELYKHNNNWIFQVNDICIYNNINYHFKSLDTRLEILDTIFEDDYDFDTFKIVKVNHYTLHYFNDFITNKKIFLIIKYQCLFKHINTNDNCMYLKKIEQKQKQII